VPVLAKKCPDSKQREISYANARLGPLVLEENLNRSESKWWRCPIPPIGRCPFWVIRVGLNRASASSDVRFAPKADIVSRRRRQCRGLTVSPATPIAKD